MKKVLLISNEETPDNMGTILMSSRFGLMDGLYDIPNLQDTIRRMGAFDVVTVHHTEIAAASMTSPDYIILSGRFSANPLSNDAIRREYQTLLKWIPNADAPMLGICMGLQLICCAFGVPAEPMEKREGEYGFTRLHCVQPHPLLTDFDGAFFGMELHRSQASSVPEGFMLLARSADCRVQMIAHTSRPIVATQFHPELNTDCQQDGERLLRRFFAYYDR